MKTLRNIHSTEEVLNDERALFSAKEERLTWWNGVTEFWVDAHYLAAYPMNKLEEENLVHMRFHHLSGQSSASKLRKRLRTDCGKVRASNLEWRRKRKFESSLRQLGS